MKQALFPVPFTSPIWKRLQTSTIFKSSAYGLEIVILFSFLYLFLDSKSASSVWLLCSIRKKFHTIKDYSIFQQCRTGYGNIPAFNAIESDCTTLSQVAWNERWPHAHVEINHTDRHATYSLLHSYPNDCTGPFMISLLMFTWGIFSLPSV